MAKEIEYFDEKYDYHQVYKYCSGPDCHKLIKEEMDMCADCLMYQIKRLDKEIDEITAHEMNREIEETI